MTTFQDPPPQSRRSARQSERDEAPEIAPEITDFAPTIEPAEQNPDFSAPSVPASAVPASAVPASTVPATTAPVSTVTDPALQTRSGRRAREAAGRPGGRAPRSGR